MDSEFFYYHYSYIFSEDEKNNFFNTFRENNICEFCIYMDRIINSDESIARYISEKNLNIDVTEFKEKILHSIARRATPHYKNILEILLTEYNFQLDDIFIKKTINSYFITSEIFVLLNDYINLKIYFPEIKQAFWKSRRFDKHFDLEAIKNTQKNLNVIGLSTTEFCDMQDCADYYDSLLYGLIECDNIQILKYFLDEGLNFKKYELDVIMHCIEYNKIEHLELLIDYGIDISLLEKTNKKFQPKKIQLYNLLVKNNIDPFFAAMMININMNILIPDK